MEFFIPLALGLVGFALLMLWRFFNLHGRRGANPDPNRADEGRDDEDVVDRSESMPVRPQDPPPGSRPDREQKGMP